MCVCVGVALSAVDMFFSGAKTLLTSQRGEALMEIEEEGDGEQQNAATT